MTEPAKSPSVRPRRFRRAWKVVATLLVVLVAAVALIPTALNTEGGRRWLLAKANATLSPGKLEVDRFRFSWFGPTRMDHFVIRDPEGEAVVEATSADWDRNLFQILFSRPKYGTLALKDTSLDVERHADGSIDVVEALQSILKGEPPTDFTILVQGTLRLRDSGLTRPIEADDFHLKIRRPAAPGNVTWDANLRDVKTGHTLNVVGAYRRWEDGAEGQKGLRVELDADGWPLHLKTGGLAIGTALTGHGSLTRDDGRWASDASLSLAAMSLSGESLNGDRVALDSLRADWDVKQLPSGWSIRDVRLKSKLVDVSTSGPWPISDKDAPGRITGRVDLAALAAALPKTLRLRDDLKIEKGTASIDLTCVVRGGTHAWTADANLADLAGHVGETAVSIREPITMSAGWREAAGWSGFNSLRIHSAFLEAGLSRDPHRGVEIVGTYDLAALALQAGDFVDLGSLDLTGSGRFKADMREVGDNVEFRGSTTLPWGTLGPKDDALEVSGLSVMGTVWRGRSAAAEGWNWDLGVSLDSAKRAGLELGQARFAISKHGQDQLAIEPIDAVLNGGKLHLVPELEFSPRPILRLKSGTELVDAVVNVEASRRVLTFIAPILDGGTRVTGRVSARIDRAEFPLSKGVSTGTVVEGKVVFQDLEFAPGPIAADLLGLVGRSDATLKLDQPVVLSIADGRVRQSGLVIPVGKVAKIEIAGDVGFDRSLDLRATIPIMPEMFPNGGLVGEVVSGTRITIPITGTLSRPKIDRDAFRAELSRTGKGLMVRGAADLLFRLARPRDPNAPPPLTPAERKARRQERRMEKRGGS